MNTTPVLERAPASARTDLDRRVPDTGNPARGGVGRAAPHRWRRRPRPATVVALAALAALAGGSVVLAGTGERDAERRAAIEQLTDERDAALASADALEGELDSLRSRAARLDGDLAQRSEQLADLERQMADTIEELDAANASAAQLQLDLVAARAEAGQAIADRDAVLERFPVSTGGDLGDRNVAGDYTVELSNTYCSTSGACRLPKIDRLTIATTREGYLWLRLPGLVDAGLLRAGAALHAVTDTSTTVNACDGATRPARVAVTVFPATELVDADGDRRIASLGATITVDAPATATCPAVLAVHAAELTPR